MELLPLGEIAALSTAFSTGNCPLLRKLGNYAQLSDDDAAALTSLPHQLRSYSAHTPIAAAGERQTRVAILVDGIAARTKHMEDGRRQIVSFHVPGDLLDLHGLLFAVADHHTEAISRCQVALVPHRAVQQVMEDRPVLARALLYETFVDAAISREWVANIGRRSAYERMAHLFCEFAYRLYLIGQTEDGRFTLPVAQTDLSDALGITAVHANRVLQLLRSEQLIVTRSRTVEILDWERLVGVAGFDASYLHSEGIASGSLEGA